jgi:triosephosphate isomerase (TIM)
MSQRKKIIAGNWKMNKTASEARKLVQSLLLEIGSFDEADIVLCPPFTALATVSELLQKSTNIHLGAQNLHQATSGAFTGEIAADMLRDLYCRYVIIGHSERRQYFHETDALIQQKIKTALSAGLKPIVCIG